MTHPILSYCERHKLSLHRFAGKIGVRSSTIYRLIRPARDRVRRPSAELMGRIEKLTDGEITMRALYATHFGPGEAILCPTGGICKGKQDHATSAGGA